MRVSQSDMNESHDRIVKGTSHLLRERGIRDTSVADAMSAAGMTHGGFYRHFKNKDDLVVEALRLAFEGFLSPLEERQVNESAAEVVDEYKRIYLSEEHMSHPSEGCPMPSLGGEVARESELVKAEFAAGLRRVVAAMSKSKDGRDEERTAEAIRDIALMVGAILLARASGSEFGPQVLAACRE